MKNKFSLIVIVFSFLLLIDLDSKESAVTYVLNGGRFGDNISSYSRAKWISYKYKIPLLYRPIHHSKELQVHRLEKHYRNSHLKLFTAVQEIPEEGDYEIDPEAGILYEVAWKSNVEIDWEDREFLKIIRNSLALKKPLNPLNIPSDMISIAMHLRSPGWYPIDNETLIHIFPLRWVTTEFYIEQLKRIMSLYPDKQFFVHIFTDHHHPEILVSEIDEQINDERVHYDFRTEGNRHNLNVVQDFWHMTQYNCLIRAESQFSKHAEVLGEYDIVIWPTESVPEEDNNRATEVMMKRRVEAGWEYSTHPAEFIPD